MNCKGEKPQKEAELGRLRDKIREGFALGTATLPQLYHSQLHQGEKSKALKLPLSHARLWVQSIRLARRQHQNDEVAKQAAAYRSTRSSRAFMFNWLNNVSNQPSPQPERDTDSDTDSSLAPANNPQDSQ